MLKAIHTSVWILILISLSVVLSAQTNRNPKGVIGKINNKAYTYEEYNGILDNYYNYWQSREGTLSSERKKELNNKCWEELIARAVYDDEIKRRGINVPDQEALDSVIKDPPIQVQQIEALKTNGKFDTAKFKQALDMDAKFKESVLTLVKESMIYDKLLRVIKSQVKAKPDSIKNVWLNNNNFVSAKIIYFDYNQMPKQIVPDSSSIRYYNDYRDKYIKEPARKYRFVKITGESENIAKVRADSLYQALTDGADFAELAQQFSEDPGSGKNGGDLGWFGKGRMVKIFEDTAFALEINQISEPVKSQFGWHIIQTLEKRKDDQGKDEVRARHILVKPQPDAEAAEQLILSAKEQGLSKAAAKLNYPVEETQEFYEKDRGIREIGQYPEKIKEAFTNPVGYIPAFVAGRNGEAYVLELSDSLGTHYSPYEKEKAGIDAILEKEMKISANKEFARSFYNKHQGEDYISIAESDSMKIIEANDIKQDSNIPGIPVYKPLNDSLLATEEGQYTSLVENESNAFLALVTKREKPNMSNWAKQKNKLIAEANDSVKTKHVNSWYYSQRQNLKIEDNRKDFYELPKQQGGQQIQINPQ